MLTHIAFLADEFLLEQGFTIVDPGPGLPRTATRGELRYEIEPRCRCTYCPEHANPNYVRLKPAA